MHLKHAEGTTMRISRWIQAGVLAAGLSVTPGFAQSGSDPAIQSSGSGKSSNSGSRLPTDATGGAVSPSNMNRTEGYAVKENHNFKWVGLIALAGILGLLLARGLKQYVKPSSHP